MEDAARVITLELRLDGQSPIGRASTPDHRQRAFAGWLGLIAAIEAVLADPDTGGQNPGGHQQQPRHDDTGPEATAERSGP